MCPILNVTVTIFNINNGHQTWLSLTTYLNVILLFMAFCDSNAVFSRTRIARCLALIDFFGALLSQLTPDCILSRYFNGCSVLLPYEICFLVLERLAFHANTNLLRLTQATFRNTLRDNVFYHGLSLLLSLVLVSVLFRGSVEMPLVFRAVMRNTLLRGVFFYLDGFAIYSVNVLAPREERKQGQILKV